MRRTRLSKGARRALLNRFPPDGYVIVEALDQTIGFWTGTGWTIKHPEAKIYADRAEAAEVVRSKRGSWIDMVPVAQHFRDRPDTW